MFFVMKHEHLYAIPDRLIIKRWRQDAKDIGQYVDDIEEESERGFLLRHGALYAASQWMLFVGAKKQELFRVALNGIRNVCRDLENGNAKPTDGASKRVDVGIRDPVVVRTKGAPSSKKLKSKKRRCTTCRKTGHTKRRCTVSRRSFNETDATKGADISNTDRAEVKNVEADCKKGVTIAGVDVDVLEEHLSGDKKCDGDRIVCTAQSQNMQELGDQNELDWETKVMDILRKLNPRTEAKS
ncbi:uncharacterized protein LOC107648653 isoform X1 [Arachis ipaensis]|nr:uncharacterized protein LOC107648653 isoform X1 [Arachis ipaensis]